MDFVGAVVDSCGSFVAIEVRKDCVIANSERAVRLDRSINDFHHDVRDEELDSGYLGADVMMKVIDRSIQAHGALGISDDTVLSYFYRNERGARIYDGPDEVHRSVVARQVLKQYSH